MKDGGPAFPGDCRCNNGKAGCIECGFGKRTGISKLDYFAVEAMKGLLAGGRNGTMEELIEQSWELAEIMLAESERRNDG